MGKLIKLHPTLIKNYWFYHWF